MGAVKNVVHDTGLQKGQIDDIVPVGGSMRIPKVKQRLETMPPLILCERIRCRLLTIVIFSISVKIFIHFEVGGSFA
ncbi:unnamed protein product [Cochlearia groenlandica]